MSCSHPPQHINVLIDLGTKRLLQCGTCGKLVSELTDIQTNKPVWVEGNFVINPESRIYVLAEDIFAFKRLQLEVAEQLRIPLDKIVYIDQIGVLKKAKDPFIYLAKNWWERDDIIQMPEFARIMNSRM